LMLDLRGQNMRADVLRMLLAMMELMELL
jgi:hypothetical protein